MGILQQARPVVIICTRDRALALPFYRDVLGLKLIAEDPFAAVFELQGGVLRLSTVADWTAHPHTVFGFEIDDMKSAVSALKKAGVSFLRYPGFGQDEDGVWTSPDAAAKVAWFNDPDGNNLSVTALK